MAITEALPNMTLSLRGRELAKPNPQFFFWDIITDTWNPQSNPDGYVCLGLAENELMHEKLAEHIPKNISLIGSDFTYGDGKKRLKTSFARFLNRHFNPVVPLEAAHITPTNGCSTAVEHAAYLLGNPGDTFLLGKPFYGTFVADFTLRMGTRLATVGFGGADPLGPGCVAKYEEKIREVQQRGERIAGMILAHPHNPLGRCYPRSVLIELMKLCQKYQIHFICDEIYALSTFTNTIDTDIAEVHPFESALSIDTKDLINPALVHVIWGMSKDFGANGLRLGAIISQRNPALHRALVPIVLYSSTSSLTDCAAANMLDDDAWVDEFIAENRRGLQSNYEHVARWARSHGFEYAAGVNAAFFLWLDLGTAYRRAHPELDSKADIDEVVKDALLQNKVFIASGAQFGSEKPGWCRLAFGQKRDYLDEGLRRIVTAIEQ